MHCKQMKPNSLANNTQQKGQQIKTTLNKGQQIETRLNKGQQKKHSTERTTTWPQSFTKSSMALHLIKGLWMKVRNRWQLLFTAIWSSSLALFKEKLFQFSCCRLFVLLLIYFTVTVMSAGGRLQSCILHTGIECNFTLMMTLMTSKVMVMVMKMMMLVASCLNIL